MTGWLPIRRWTVWYGDGSTFRSEDGPWEDAPAEGVQAVVIDHDAPYRTVMANVDEYVLPGETAVKYGQEIPWDQYLAVLRAAGIPVEE